LTSLLTLWGWGGLNGQNDVMVKTRQHTATAILSLAAERTGRIAFMVGVRAGEAGSPETSRIGSQFGKQHV